MSMWLIIPNLEQTLAVGTLSSILKQVNISAEDFLQNLSAFLLMPKLLHSSLVCAN